MQPVSPEGSAGLESERPPRLLVQPLKRNDDAVLK